MTLLIAKYIIGKDGSMADNKTKCEAKLLTRKACPIHIDWAFDMDCNPIVASIST
jgi:hypothetical protein